MVPPRHHEGEGDHPERRAGAVPRREEVTGVCLGREERGAGPDEIGVERGAGVSVEDDVERLAALRAPEVDESAVEVDVVDAEEGSPLPCFRGRRYRRKSCVDRSTDRGILAGALGFEPRIP